MPTASMTECAPSPPVSSLILATPASPRLDDVGSSVGAGELLTLRVARHRDDPLRTELLGGQDGHETDRAVTDDRHGLAGAGLGSVSGEPAGAEHV